MNYPFKLFLWHWRNFSAICVFPVTR